MVQSIYGKSCHKTDLEWDYPSSQHITVFFTIKKQTNNHLNIFTSFKAQILRLYGDGQWLKLMKIEWERHSIFKEVKIKKA